MLQLLDKLRNAGIPLGDYVNGRFYRGILTGFNEAFIIDKATKDRLISEYSSSAEVLKPFLRGRDVKRWVVNFAEQYLIKIESSENKKHPWSDKPDIEAEMIFSETYPAIYQWLNQYREQLIQRYDQGKYFWELRSCKYWDEFENNKIIIPSIIDNVEYLIDQQSYYTNDKTSICISDSLFYLIGLLNSQLLWWFIKYIAPERQNGFLEFKPMYVSQIPIPTATNKQDTEITEIVNKIIKIKNNNPDADVSNLEKEIDEIVYKLYELTPEEIAIVEGKEGKQC
ncbi:TaqI-like C-terminal specificity domain-containing protein [Crocosphaera chwakensis]|uniref:site-specific DNA-methyltransferase (adenine-specific) n=1 Tax=Crocosphaera chwakensis CCY0110 TaxID=391612 RepID=A3IT45_9CHRO|nr:TaqI-like C-terminal specificity domain-containing protein [Crocosphaera chwakensis]EAZ90349.1 type IIS restriction-modification protein [Crocosphaera chwakensis CCY0110]